MASEVLNRRKSYNHPCCATQIFWLLLGHRHMSGVWGHPEFYGTVRSRG